jgi:DNA-binding GntR family transcriptional regulator
MTGIQKLGGGRLEYQTAASVAEATIRAAILNGAYEPGDELREVTLAEELGLSRTPIREALLALQAAGLVEATRGRTARVRERTLDELMDAYELRAEVEAYTARRAAQHVSAEELAAMWASCDRFGVQAEGDDMRMLVHENLVFHDLVHHASRNRRAPEIIRGLVEMPLVYASYEMYSLEKRRLTTSRHCAITRALEGGDGDLAASLMRGHIIECGRSALETKAAATK